jgi:hypothetical protein
MCHRSESTVNQYVTNRIADPDHGSRIPDPDSLLIDPRDTPAA